MPESPLDLLTPAERRAAELYAAGHTYDEIARRLSITKNTLKRHLENARDKFDCRKQSAFRAKFERLREEEADRRSHDFSGEWLLRVLWVNSTTGDRLEIYASLHLERASPLSAYYVSRTGLVGTHEITITGPPERARRYDGPPRPSPIDVILGDEHRVRAVAASQFDVHHLTLEWIDGGGNVCAAVVMKLDRNHQQMDGELGGFIEDDCDYTLKDQISLVAVTRERFDTVVRLWGESDRNSRRQFIAEHHPDADVDNGALHHFLLFVYASAHGSSEREIEAAQAEREQRR